MHFYQPGAPVREEKGMKVKADLDKLDMLRDLALCGSEEKHEQAQQDYEELRAELLAHEPCGGCDEDIITKELKMKDGEGETTKTPYEDKAKDFDWEPNREDQNPEKD
jgi:hypothetical protein